MNFGETLAYWYLRLNGFFLLQNYVLHRRVENLAQSADADMLAFRLPEVYEEIGGVAEDWDQERFGAWGLEFKRHMVGLVVEVKTSPDINRVQRGATRAFRENRLIYATQRFGFLPRQEAKSFAEELFKTPFLLHEQSNCLVGKLLVSATPLPPQEEPRYLTLTLSQAATFIEARMKKYKQVKVADRMFFPNDLLQYIIWTCREQ